MNNEQQKLILQQVDMSQVQTSNVFKNLDINFRNVVTELQKSLLNEIKETKASVERIEERTVSRERVRALLDSLYFNTLDARQESLHDAYKNTFDWIFDSRPDAVRPWSNFVEWLQSGEALYWINGKAGSGKSTVCIFNFG